MNLRPRRPPPPAIELTPLLDVVFLLLIFFMVSTTFEQDTRIEVQLPEIRGGDTPTANSRVLEIGIDTAGAFSVNGQPVADREPDMLQRAIREVVGDEREIPVVIMAAAETPHRAVMTAMDVASRLGLLRIAFAATRSDPIR